MGFFDSITKGAKELVNRATGGYGEMVFDMQEAEASPGGTVPIFIKLIAKAELKAKRLVVRLRGQEKCQLDIAVQNEQGHTQNKRETFYNNTKEDEFQISGEIQMKEGETKEFSGDIIIPQDCQPTYYGVLAEHKWTMEADLDIPWGKDLKQSREIFIR